MLKKEHTHLVRAIRELVSCIHSLHLKDEERNEQMCEMYRITVTSDNPEEPEIGFMEFGILPTQTHYCVVGSDRLHIQAHPIPEYMALSFWITLLKEYANYNIKDGLERQEATQCIYLFEIGIIKEPERLQ